MSWPLVDPESGLPVEIKQTAEVKTLVFDFSAHLRDSPIASVSAYGTVNFERVTGSAELTAGTPVVVDGYSVHLPISGGTDDEVYRATVRVVDEDGDVHEMDCAVYVIEA